MDTLTLRLKALFPNITTGNYLHTSPPTASYNCIAWAAGDNTRWWWPDSGYNYYWPVTVPRNPTLSTFVAAYATLGYEVTGSGKLEEGYEKIVVYLDAQTKLPSHAARQLDDGRWTSKLGAWIDISHLNAGVLEGDEYGVAAQFMRRKKK